VGQRRDSAGTAEGGTAQGRRASAGARRRKDGGEAARRRQGDEETRERAIQPNMEGEGSESWKKVKWCAQYRLVLE
jgi:hypothetical protein